MRKRLFLSALIILAASTSFAQDDYTQLIEEAKRTLIADPKHAEQLLGRARQIRPAEPLTYVLIGTLRYEQGALAEASREFKRSIELCSTQDQKRFCVSTTEVITQSFRNEKEVELFQQASQNIKQKRSKEAVPLLESALKINPKNSKLYYEIGYAYVELKDYNKAIHYLEKGRNINPLHRKTLAELRYCYSEVGDFDGLRQVIFDIALIYGESFDLYHELGFAYAKAGKADSAIAVFENLLEKFPDSYLSRYTLGRIYFFDKKDKKRAKELLEAFLESAREKRLDVNAGITLDQMVEEATKIVKECSE